MTDHERWVVYPLLFLALGVSLRDKITRTYNEVQTITGKTMQINLTTGTLRSIDGRMGLDLTHGRIGGRGVEIDADVIRCKRLVFETVEGKEVSLSPNIKRAPAPNRPLQDLPQKPK